MGLRDIARRVLGKGKQSEIRLPPARGAGSYPREMSEENLISCFNARVCITCGAVLIVLLSLLGRDYDGTVHRKKQRAAGNES